MEENVMKRLALIRYMYKQAVIQSYQADPLYGLSILTFQDSIELFLQLSCEYIGVGINPKKELAFMEYFELIKIKLSEELSQRDSIYRLNKARVAFKHHGNIPSKLDIESFRASSTSFFEENALKLFEINFSDISIIHLIKCQQTKDKLFKTIAFMKKYQLKEASEMVAIAFREMISVDLRKSSGSLGDLLYEFDYGRNLKFINLNDEYSVDFKGERNDLKVIEGMFKEAGNQLNNIGEILQIVALNIDYKKFIKFKSIVPQVDKCIGGEYFIGEIEQLPTEDELQYCIDFVIECALNLQRI